MTPPGFIEDPGRDEVPVDLEEWGDTPAEAVEHWLYGRLSGLQDDVAFETTELWPAPAEARRQPQPFVRTEDYVLRWGFELDGRVVLALRPLSVATFRFDQRRS